MRAVLLWFLSTRQSITLGVEAVSFPFLGHQVTSGFRADLGFAMNVLPHFCSGF